MSKILHQQDFRRTKFTPKSEKIWSKFKLRQNDIINQMCFNSRVPKIGLTTALLSIELLPKKYAEFGPKVKQWQNTVHLEQQIYASPENFTQTLLVVLETFRRSAAGVLLTMAGVLVTMAGVLLTMAGVLLAMVWVLLTMEGVLLTMAGVLLTMEGVLLALEEVWLVIAGGKLTRNRAGGQRWAAD